MLPLVGKVPGAAELLMKELLTVTLIETCSELEKKHVYSDMIERTVTMLDVAVTRLVSRLCQVTTGALTPTLNDDNTGHCPECVAKYPCVVA